MENNEPGVQPETGESNQELQRLVNIAFEKSVEEAIREAQKIGPAIEDELQRTLAQPEFLEKLKESKKVDSAP